MTTAVGAAAFASNVAVVQQWPGERGAEKGTHAATMTRGVRETTPMRTPQAHGPRSRRDAGYVCVPGHGGPMAGKRRRVIGVGCREMSVCNRRHVLSASAGDALSSRRMSVCWCGQYRRPVAVAVVH